MKEDNKQLAWAMFSIFALGLNFGQEHHGNTWRAIGLCLYLAVIFYMVAILWYSLVSTTNRTRRRTAEWGTNPKEYPSPLKKRPNSSGMVRTVAAVAEATGTPATAPDPNPRPRSSDERTEYRTPQPRAQVQGMPILPRPGPCPEVRTSAACPECLAEIENGVCTNNPQHWIG